MGNLIRRSCLRSTFPIFGAGPRNEAVMWGWGDGVMWGWGWDDRKVGGGVMWGWGWDDRGMGDGGWGMV